MKIERKPKSNLCRWNCGRETKNHSGICDECWHAAEILRSNTDAGYKAWGEHKKAKEAAKKKKPTSDKQRAALTAARTGKLLKQLPATGLFEAGDTYPRVIP